MPAGGYSIAPAAGSPRSAAAAATTRPVPSEATMATVRSAAAPGRLTGVEWVICIISAIGFAFDSYVLLMLPLIIRPALVELLGVPAASPAINNWVGILFNVPAIAGGIFGL